ncbi:MAG TPA: substrate-binding domain-containing protein [Gaiellaceae bacterium]|nr:substrate-binding domain-containing protein [Gaiellaceae bacterium]
MKRRWAWLLAAGVAVTVLAGIGGAVAEQSQAREESHTVKVGIVYSRTGLLASYGAQYIQGLRFGLQYLTKGTNRVAGHKIEITAVDDGTDPAKAVSAARDLIGRGYKIIGGSTSSGVALQVAPLAEQNRVLFISGPAATDAVTGVNRYTFRSGRQNTQDVITAREILGRSTGRKILVFAQDSAFGQGNVAAVRQYLGGRGHIVSSILVPLSAQDFTPYAQRVKQADPDLLFVAWAGTTAPAMWRALEQQGVTRRKIATGLDQRNTWSLYPAGIQLLSHYVAEAPRTKINDWLRKTMKRRNQVPDLFTPDGFVAAQMIVRAVSKGGGSDVNRMIAALEGWKFNAPKGQQQIRKADHAMLQPMFHVRIRTVGGKRRAVPVRAFGMRRTAPAVTPFKS